STPAPLTLPCISALVSTSTVSPRSAIPQIWRLRSSETSWTVRSHSRIPSWPRYVVEPGISATSLNSIAGSQIATTPSGSLALARSKTRLTRSAASPTLFVVVPAEPRQGQPDDEAEHRGQQQGEDQRDVGGRDEELHLHLLGVLEDEDQRQDDDGD